MDTVHTPEATSWAFPTDQPFVAQTCTVMGSPESDATPNATPNANATPTAHHEAAQAGGLFILLALQGQAHIRIDRQPYTLIPSTQAVVLPGAWIEAEQLTADFRMLRVGCATQTFEQIAAELEPEFLRFVKQTPVVQLPSDEELLLRQMMHLAHAAMLDTHNPYRPQMLANYLQNILYHFYSRTNDRFQPNPLKWNDRKEELFKDFIALLHEHCTTCRDVAWYADRMHISPRYLSSIVTRASGETAKDIIARHVVAQIKVRLKTTRLNVQEIAQEMNFINPSFFCRYFRKHAGMSPLQYRNET